MDTPDPYVIITPGLRVHIDVTPDVRAKFVVDFVRRGLGMIWCSFGPAPEVPKLVPESTVYMMEVGDPAGLLKLPVSLANSTLAERSDGNFLKVSFKVLPGTIWVQRRKYFRLRSPPIVITLRVPHPDSVLLLDIPTRALNLGGGGVAVAVAQGDYQPGDCVELVLKLANTAPLPAMGILERVETLGTGEKLLAIQFTEMREGHRDRLVSVIFREQTRRHLGG